MDSNSNQQAYDRGITIFSPDGRLYQVEYAREAVKRGTASVGVRTTDGVVLVANSRTGSPLMEPASVEKLHRVDDHIAIASAGHVADARQLIDFARRQAQANHLRYGEPIDVETLTKTITDHIQQYTQTGGARPFGVALLVAGVDGGTPRLFETDPSGTPYEWKAAAVGGSRDAIQSYLESHYHDGLSLDDGVSLALEALASVADGNGGEPTLDPTGIDVAVVDTDSERFEQWTTDAVADRLAALELVAEDE